MQSTIRNKKIMTTYQLTAMALFTAITCILGPMSIQIGIIPISLTNLVLFLAVFLLGGKLTAASYLIYLLLGIVGLPVFSGFTGGMAKVTGPTGGFLVGFIWLIIISGFFLKMFPKKIHLYILGMILGMIVCYLFGTAWFVILMKVTWKEALIACVLPFIIGDILKIAIVALIGPALQKRLSHANLL